MKHSRSIVALVTIAFIVHVSSWFLPVAGAEYPGWKAFRVAFASVWPYDGVSDDSVLGAIVSTASALTNVWFALAFVALAFRRDDFSRLAFWGLTGSALLNAVWLVGAAGAPGPGYFAWLSSFVLLAVAIRMNDSVAAVGSHPIGGGLTSA